MSKQHGKIGAIYLPVGLIRATTISFTGTSNYINDSGNGFVAAGFTSEDKIVVTGSGSNNTTFNVVSGGVAVGRLTVTGSPTPVVTELAGANVLIVTATPGATIAGCNNWSLDKSVDLAESTDFADGATAIPGTSQTGVKTRVAGVFDWKAQADRLWNSASNQWLGSVVGSGIVMVRLFEKYVASPSAPNPSYYWEGLAYVETTNVKVDVEDANKQTFGFTGIGPISLITKTSAW